MTVFLVMALIALPQKPDLAQVRSVLVRVG